MWLLKNNNPTQKNKTKKCDRYQKLVKQLSNQILCFKKNGRKKLAETNKKSPSISHPTAFPRLSGDASMPYLHGESWERRAAGGNRKPETPWVEMIWFTPPQN